MEDDTFKSMMGVSLLNDFDDYLLQKLEESSNIKQGETPSTADFTFYINGGLDMTKLEKGYTHTHFFLA